MWKTTISPPITPKKTTTGTAAQTETAEQTQTQIPQPPQTQTQQKNRTSFLCFILCILCILYIFVSIIKLMVVCLSVFGCKQPISEVGLSTVWKLSYSLYFRHNTHAYKCL